MKRVIGAAAGIDYFKRERNLPVEAVLSNGRGLFTDKVSPIEFASRVIDIVRNEGDVGLARINTALDGSSPATFEVPESEINAAFKSLDPASINALELLSLVAPGAPADISQVSRSGFVKEYVILWKICVKIVFEYHTENQRKSAEPSQSRNPAETTRDAKF